MTTKIINPHKHEVHSDYYLVWSIYQIVSMITHRAFHS